MSNSQIIGRHRIDVFSTRKGDTLAERGIAAVGLEAQGPAAESNGNLVIGTATLERADGSTALVADVDLAAAEPGWAEIGRRANLSILRGENDAKAAALLEGARTRMLNLGTLGVGLGFGTSGNDVILTGGAGATAVGGAGADVLLGGGAQAITDVRMPFDNH